MTVELYQHQQDAVDKLNNGKILFGDVGTGKSLTALVYYYTKVCKGVVGDFGSMREPRDLYIITTARKRDSGDWIEELSTLEIFAERENNPEGFKVTVDSWNNIGKYTEEKDAFFIFDEQRLVGSGAWVKAFVKISKHNQWILLTATPGDTWLDFIPVFIANGFYRNRTEFMEEHVIMRNFGKFPKVVGYRATGRLVRYRNQLLVSMPMVRATVRHQHVVVVDHDEDLMKEVVKKRWNVFEQKPARDAAQLFHIMRRVANESPSRLQAVRDLMAVHPKLIVFYNFDYELEMLRSLCVPEASAASTDTAKPSTPTANTTTEAEDPVSSVSDNTPHVRTQGSAQEKVSASIGEVSIAEWNGHKHQEIPKTDRWVYLVQYVAGAEAWNCIETDAICFFSLTYSYKNFHQAKGRIDRLNTPFRDLHYYVLRSRSKMDLAIWNSLKAKKDFNVLEMASKMADFG